MCEMQIADECAHQPRLADARCQCEAKGGKLALKVRHGRKFAANRLKRSLKVRSLPRGHDLGNPIEDFEILSLRGAKAQAAGDRVDMTIHRLPRLSPNRSRCAVAFLSGFANGLSGSVFGGAFGRFSTFRL